MFLNGPSADGPQKTGQPLPEALPAMMTNYVIRRLVRSYLQFLSRTFVFILLLRERKEVTKEDLRAEEARIKQPKVSSLLKRELVGVNKNPYETIRKSGSPEKTPLEKNTDDSYGICNI